MSRGEFRTKAVGRGGGAESNTPQFSIFNYVMHHSLPIPSHLCEILFFGSLRPDPICDEQYFKDLIRKLSDKIRFDDILHNF